MIVVLVMGTVSMTDSISVSFFSNYMLREFNMNEKDSGWILTVASTLYFVSTFASGIIGSNKKVSFKC